jgi:hypothetical protein
MHGAKGSVGYGSAQYPSSVKILQPVTQSSQDDGNILSYLPEDPVLPVEPVPPVAHG